MSKKILRKKHSAKVKFQVVMETLMEKNSIIDVSRAYGINPGLISKWRKEFLEKGYLLTSASGHPRHEVLGQSLKFERPFQSARDDDNSR